MSINVGTAVGYLDLDSSKFKAGLKDAQSTLSEFTNSSNNAGARFEALGNSLKTVGSTITTAVSLPLLALGAGAIKTASDFEYGMSEVRAITGATGEDMKKLEEQAKTLGATTKFSASDAAEGMKYFGMAGYKTDQIMSALPATLNLAAAGGTDLGIACDIVSDAMTGLGMSAEQTGKFTDIMAATITNSNTNIELMGETLKYVGPVAGTLGIEMGDLSVAIGLMGNAGIKGSQAGTALRAGLTNLVKPTKDMKVAMEKYGVELVKNADGSVDLMGTMENLRSTLGGLDQATQAQALATIFGKEAMSGFASIVNASEADFNKLSDAIANSEGKASEMASTMQNNLKGAIDNMKSAFEGVLITIGQRLIPIFQNLVEGITNVFTWFNNLSPAIQNVIIGVGGFLAILGPLLLIIGNVIIFIVKLSTSIGTLVTFFSAGGAGAGILGAAIAAITGPIGLTIAAITALIAIGVLLYNNWDTIKAKCSEIWSYICDAISKFVSNSIQWLKDKWEEGKQWLTDCWDNVKQSAIDIWNSIGDFFSETIPKWIDNIVKWFDELPYKIGYALGSLLRNIIEWGVNTWNYLETNVPKWIESVSNWFKELPGKIWQWLTNAIQKISDWGSQTYQKAKDGASKAINSVVEWFSQMPGKVWTWLSNTIQKIEEWGTNMTQKARECAVKTVESVVNGFKELPSKIKTIGSDAVKALWDGISSMTSWIKDKVSSFISGIVDGFKGVKSGISSAVGKSRLLDIPDITQKVNVIGESDYSDIKFDYIKAIQTSSSSSIATNMTEELKYLTRSIGNFDNINKHNNAKNNGNSVVINNTYNSPKPASIRELKRQDEIQMRRLSMQLGF